LSSVWWFWPSIFIGFFDSNVIGLQYLEGFWCLLEDFLKIIFMHGEIFEFP
jgi:hypothetical protein